MISYEENQGAFKFGRISADIIEPEISIVQEVEEPIQILDIKPDNELGKFDIIINTIPFQILDEERLNLVNKDVVLIDLASNPGGVDRKVAKEKGIKVIWALSLPGKVAPTTSAEFIKETIYNV